MAFAAASAGAILSLPLAPASSTKGGARSGGPGGVGGPGQSGDGGGGEQSLVREQEQLEAWAAATLGLPTAALDNALAVKDTAQYYIQSPTGNVVIDVGGVSHRVKLSNFRPCGVLPCSRLGRLFRSTTRSDALRHCDDIEEGEPPVVFFDRNSVGFNTVLDIYRTGKLHFTEKSCALVLKHDFDYWGVDEMMLEPCCALKYYPEMEVCSKEQEGERRAKRKMQEKMIEEDFGPSLLGRVRSKLWNLTEYPESGKDAQISAFFSLAVVVISTATFVLSTLEEFQVEEDWRSARGGGSPSSSLPSAGANNDTAAATPALDDQAAASFYSNSTKHPNDGDYGDGVTRYLVVIEALELIDTLCVVFFTTEYVVRFSCAPKKMRFALQAMNLVDLFAIIPFFLTIFLHQLEDVQIIGKAGKIIRLVRIMRILRVFKLVRHFAGLQSLIHTMHQAYKELGLLLFLISVTVLTVSCLVYFAERDEGIWSFVDSFWFALMTLTTVGYDLNPVTMLGKVTGGFCALLGVFILTLPIPIVVNSFASYYKNRLWRNEVTMKKKQRILEQQERKRLLKLTGGDEERTAAGGGGLSPAAVEEDEISSGGKVYGVDDEYVPLAMRRRRRMAEERRERKLRKENKDEKERKEKEERGATEEAGEATEMVPLKNGVSSPAASALSDGDDGDDEDEGENDAGVAGDGESPSRVRKLVVENKDEKREKKTGGEKVSSSQVRQRY